MNFDSKFELLVAAYIHDLKNQLQTLSNQQDKLINELPAEYQGQLTPMIRQTHQLNRDTLRLVSLFRLENNHRINMDDAWPKDTVNDAIEACLVQFPDLVIDNQISTDAQGFYNEQLIQLAFVTLMTNSAQAGAKHLVLTCEENDNQSLNIFVQDDGPGFDQDILEGLSDTTKPEGTGLGLYFVEMICSAHQSSGKQGKLTISNHSDGALASLFLP